MKELYLTKASCEKCEMACRQTSPLTYLGSKAAVSNDFTSRVLHLP